MRLLRGWNNRLGGTPLTPSRLQVEKYNFGKNTIWTIAFYWEGVASLGLQVDGHQLLHQPCSCSWQNRWAPQTNMNFFIIVIVLIHVVRCIVRSPVHLSEKQSLYIPDSTWGWGPLYGLVCFLKMQQNPNWGTLNSLQQCFSAKKIGSQALCGWVRSL